MFAFPRNWGNSWLFAKLFLAVSIFSLSAAIFNFGLKLKAALKKSSNE
jgi:hypothetical protein